MAENDDTFDYEAGAQKLLAREIKQREDRLQKEREREATGLPPVEPDPINEIINMLGFIEGESPEGANRRIQLAMKLSQEKSDRKSPEEQAAIDAAALSLGKKIYSQQTGRDWDEDFPEEASPPTPDTQADPD